MQEALANRKYVTNKASANIVVWMYVCKMSAMREYASEKKEKFWSAHIFAPEKETHNT
jgi:hypothetical protein